LPRFADRFASGWIAAGTYDASVGEFFRYGSPRGFQLLEHGGEFRHVGSQEAIQVLPATVGALRKSGRYAGHLSVCHASIVADADANGIL